MAVAELAARQWGVVALSQLCGLGLTGNGVRLRARAGHLHRVHRGVYAVGHHNLTQKGRLKAAELALGQSAAVSRRSAAALLEIRADGRSIVDVTVSNRRARSRPGVRVHQGSLLTRDVTVVEGITCTAWPRTMLDLAADLRRDATEKALERTEILRLYDRVALEDVLGRNPTHRGAATLGSLIDDRADAPAPTRNELERALLAICERHGLPIPIVNGSLWLDGDRIEPDFLWPEHRLIVETDGAETHATLTALLTRVGDCAGAVRYAAV